MTRPVINIFFGRIFVVAAALFLAIATTVSPAQEATSTPADDPVAIFNAGQDEHAKGNFKDAIDLYDKALKLLPELAEAEYQKGNAYLSLGKPDGAETAFRRALELRPEWTLALAALGTLLERRNEFVESEKLLTKAVSIDENNFPAYLGLVELRLRTSARPDVLRKLLDRISVFSSKASATAAMFASRASLEIALGDRASAKKSVAQALEMEPNNKSALYAKADLALLEGDLVRADEVAKSIDQFDAGTEAAVVLRARVLLAGGKTDDAARVLASIQVKSPETVKLKQKVALAVEQSPEVLEKALAQPGADVAFIAGRLCSLYRVSAPEKALEQCRRASEAESTNINYATGYGAALVQARRYDEAINVLRRLLLFAPDNATIHANLGTAYFQSKRYAEAKTEYQWLTSHEPVPVVAYYFLAICHDQLQEYLDAAANYNLFLKNADASRNQLEIDKVKLRMPSLDRDIKQNGGKSRSKNGGRN